MRGALQQPVQLDRLVQHGFRALNAVALPLVRAGIGGPPPVGVGVVVLETTGRRSGLPRQVPLAALRLGDTVTVSTVRHGSQWVFFFNDTATTEIYTGGRRRPAAARVRRGPLSIVTLTASA